MFSLTGRPIFQGGGGAPALDHKNNMPATIVSYLFSLFNHSFRLSPPAHAISKVRNDCFLYSDSKQLTFATLPLLLMENAEGEKKGELDGEGSMSGGSYLNNLDQIIS